MFIYTVEEFSAIKGSVCALWLFCHKMWCTMCSVCPFFWTILQFLLLWEWTRLPSPSSINVWASLYCRLFPCCLLSHPLTGATITKWSKLFTASDSSFNVGADQYESHFKEAPFIILLNLLFICYSQKHYHHYLNHLLVDKINLVKLIKQTDAKTKWMGTRQPDITLKFRWWLGLHSVWSEGRNEALIDTQTPALHKSVLSITADYSE